jgi:hypothetical protein
MLLLDMARTTTSGFYDLYYYISTKAFNLLCWYDIILVTERSIARITPTYELIDGTPFWVMSIFIAGVILIFSEASAPRGDISLMDLGPNNPTVVGNLGVAGALGSSTGSAQAYQPTVAPAGGGTVVPLVGDGGTPQTQPQPQQQPQTYAGYGGSYSSPDTASLANAYGAQFDAQTQAIQNAMNLAQQVANSGQSRVDQSYGVQQGGLQQQLQMGNANLDQSQNQLDLAKSNSLRDLGNNLRLASQSYANQAGTMGAGDSSAMDVLNYALSNQGNRQRNDVLQNAGQQQTGLNLQRSQLQGTYDQNQKMLDDWHANEMQAIVNQYATQEQQFQQALANAQGQKAIDLAYIGKGQAANSAIQQLQNLQATYNANTNQLQNAYSNIQAPDASLGAGLTNAYNVQPISAGQLTTQNLSNNQASFSPTDINANLKKTDQFGNPV